MASNQKILPQLSKTVAAIEELLLSGLTTASDATIKTLGVTFQEASRLKLLRLGSTLRSTCQELTRFVEDDPSFSNQRLVFFLHRSWILCKGLKSAIEKDDLKRSQMLLWTPSTEKKEKLRLVCLGVIKKVAVDHFCAFEFRFRDLETEQSLSWSAVFPLKKGNKIPPEGFLHLPQKQKFHPSIFTSGKIIEMEDVGISATSYGGRIQLNEKSIVKEVEEYHDWGRWLSWFPQVALSLIDKTEISPFDVDIELQTDVVVSNYQIGDLETRQDPDQKVWPVLFQGQRLELTISDSFEGKATEKALTGEWKRAKKKNDPKPILGTLHFSKMKSVVTPISLYDAETNSLQFVNLSPESIDRKALLSALSF